MGLKRLGKKGREIFPQIAANLQQEIKSRTDAAIFHMADPGRAKACVLGKAVLRDPSRLADLPQPLHQPQNYLVLIAHF